MYETLYDRLYMLLYAGRYVRTYSLERNMRLGCAYVALKPPAISA
jgi:hypothetical protein